MKNGVIITMSEEEFGTFLQSNIRQAIDSAQKKSDSEDEILKLHEVCKILSVSKPTIYSWCEQGVLRSYKIGSRRFFLRSDVLEALKSDKLNK